MEQMRSDFENWYAQKYCMLGDDFDRRNERYVYKNVHLMWEAWQASRQAIEIEMPPVCDCHSDDTDKGYDICHYRTQEYLNKQGFKFRIEGADRWAGLRIKGE